MINELRYPKTGVARERLSVLIENKERTTDLLLAELDQLIENPKKMVTGDYKLHLYAFFILAQFREPKAFSKIIDLISLSYKDSQHLYGDLVTEAFAAILYSTFDGDIQELKFLIENIHVNPYTRGAALEVLAKLSEDGQYDRSELVAYLKHLILDKGNAFIEPIATEVQNVIIDRHLFELIDEVQYLYDLGFIDTRANGPYDDFIDAIHSEETSWNRVYVIDDAIAELLKWNLVEPTEDDIKASEAKMADLEAKMADLKARIAANEAEMERRNILLGELGVNYYDESIDIGKVGRNDPCPCGSGKKFKKCCLNKKFIAETAVEKFTLLMDYPDKDKILDEYITLDEEALEIDELVYLALHFRPENSKKNSQPASLARLKISYLREALALFLDKTGEEEIDSFSEYDSIYKFHYGSQQWVTSYKQLMVDHHFENEYAQDLEKVEAVLEKFKVVE